MRPARVAAVVAWVAFAATAAALVATAGAGVWSRKWPWVLIALAATGWRVGLLDRAGFARRAVMTGLAAAGLSLVHYPPGWSLAWLLVGKLTTTAALIAATIDATPPWLAGLARRLDETLTARPDGWAAWAVAVFGIAVPMAAYCYFGLPHKVATGDTTPVIPTVVRMFEAGDRDLSEYVDSDRHPLWKELGPRPYNLVPGPDGAGWYSAYPAGMEAFAGPAVGLASLAAADLHDQGTQLALHFATAAVLAGACLGLVFLSALRIGGLAAAATTAVLLGTGSALWTTTGQALWQQAGVAFWTAVAVWVELRAGGRVGWTGTIVQGLACGGMLACRPTAVTFLVPFGLWVLARDWRRGLAVPALAAAAYLPWAAVYLTHYGQPLGPSAGFLSGSHRSIVLTTGGPLWAPAAHLGGVLLSPGRGLLVYQPLALLVPLLAVPAVRRFGPGPAPAGWGAFAGAFVGGHLLLMSSWAVWWGGWCYGSRLVSEVVPVLGLLAVRPVGWLLAARWGWLPVLAVAAAGFAAQSGAAYPWGRAWNYTPASIDHTTERLWSWPAAPFVPPAP